MSQTGHDPHGYNPMNYQRHYLGAILLAIGVNLDTSNQLINSNTQGTISIRMFQQNKITLQCKRSGVLILTDLYLQNYMLHVKFQCVFTILRRYIIYSQYISILFALQVFRS